MNEKLELPIGDKKLVVFINDWQDRMPKEIFVCVEDSSGALVQDICMVREHYHFNPKRGGFDIDSSMVDCKVWSDSENEDYTHEFTIGINPKED